jgi:hypothetical protein
VVTKKKRKEPAFAKVPLWWAEAATKAAKDPAALILIRLLYLAWKARKLTFPLPNSYFTKNGASRKTKYRVLRDLEVGGLITVERQNGKSPSVTIVVL